MPEVQRCHAIDWDGDNLPDPSDYVFEHLKWGNVVHVGSPAFWAFVTQRDGVIGEYTPTALGTSLYEEVAACMLCGYGVRSEVGLAFFDRLRDSRLLDAPHSAAQYEEILREPILVEGRAIRYRFPKTKAMQLAEAMLALSQRDFDILPDAALRGALMDISGIGPKTSAFVLRNRRGSDSVAILDVHVVQCCRHVGIFSRRDDPSRAYFRLERRFIAFASAIGVRPSHLDAVMWNYGREIPSTFALD